MPNAIIVGAGIAGLSAAQVLTDAGWQVEIIDKGQTPGGRFASRWFGDRTRRIDVGAQFLSARDPVFAAAVDQWPREGVPANPRAWLVSAGRFKAIDTMRRRARFDASLGAIAERLDARCMTRV